MSSTMAEPSPAAYQRAMADYTQAGELRAAEIGNRGPLKLDADGRLHLDILDAYWKHGFYIFTDVVGSHELEELRLEVGQMIERAPARKGLGFDSGGRPAFGRDFAVEPYLFVKPLSDPWGGTQLLGGRHQTQMSQPTPDADAPDEVVHLMFGMCQAMPSALRLYGHPHLLKIAEAINGPDFVPYNDAIFVKKPGLGASVSWHQDGVTHWDSPDWDEGIHGFNFQVQLYETTAANGLWVVPGTHKLGRLDIKGIVADNDGSDRLPDAVPLLCQPGDVTIANRQILHGSFANTSPDQRVSITFGFHRRASVLGQSGGLSLKSKQGPADGKSEDGFGFGEVFDEERIFDRSAVIAVAIDARHQQLPDEVPFTYQPFVGLEDDFRFTDETFERVIRDYNLKDLAI